MKKVLMAMVLIMVLMTAGMAEESEATTLIPHIEVKDLDDAVIGSYDMKVYMFMTMPEYEYAKMVLSVTFTDDECDNYNESMAMLYDGNTGEFIDGISGNVTSEIDCSSRDVQTVIGNMMSYFDTYDFSADAERGVVYYEVSICY